MKICFNARLCHRSVKSVVITLNAQITSSDERALIHNILVQN